MSHDFCITCQFWSGDRHDPQNVGACHRFPPVCAGIVSQQTIVGGVQPVPMIAQISCAGSHWCGEWRAESAQ